MNDKPPEADSGIPGATAPTVTVGAPEGAPRLSGELIRRALLGEVAVPPDSPLKIDSRGARMEGVIVEGGLDLSAVKFDRPIAFTRCTFEGPISMREVKLGGSVSFTQSKAPAITAELAEIGGDLDLRGVQLDNPGAVAFNGRALRLTGAAHFGDGFVSNGSINLNSSVIGGSLWFRGGVIRQPTQRRRTDVRAVESGEAALDCMNATIHQNLAFVDGFQIEGLVWAANLRVDGNLVTMGASFTSGGGEWSGIMLLNARIGGMLMLILARQFEGVLSLGGAIAGRLAEDGSFWRDAATGQARAGVELELDNFRYGSFFDVPFAPTDVSWRTRLAWLKAQRKASWTIDFHSQPFTQCAEVLRNMGDSHSARMILFERERLRLKSKNIGFWEKLGGHVLGALAGYGYKNHYALYWAVGVWLIGALVFATADRLGEMRPADPHVLAEARYEETGLPPRDYEPVNALLYSADIFLPIVALGQQEYWIPRNAGERAPDAAAALPRLHHSLVPAVNWLFGGWLPKAYYYFEIAMGWLLVSIVIAGFSGLLGHAREE